MSEAAKKHESQPRGSRSAALRLTAPSPRVSPPHLLIAEPFLRLSDRLDRYRSDREELTPGDPVARALAIVRGWLKETIDEASDIGSVMDVDTAAHVLDLSTSMVTVLCRRGPEAGGLDAQKVGGEWRISRASVEARLGKRA